MKSDDVRVWLLAMDPFESSPLVIVVSPGILSIMVGLENEGTRMWAARAMATCMGCIL